MTLRRFLVRACLALIAGCSAQHPAFAGGAIHRAEDAAAACGCGDGIVEGDEECDPAAPDWEGLCDEQCRRTVYQACEGPDCGGENDTCAAYTSDPRNYFCASYCENDDACPALPGFESICNFAWCTVLCDDGECPTGMICVPGAKFLDRSGAPRGDGDVCVIAPE